MAHDLLRVVNFDSDGKSDQKIDIFSANQISAFLQQLTPPFRRFFRKKSDWEWRQLIFLRVGGEDMVKAVSLVTWAEAGSNWCEIWKVSWCCALCLDLVFYHIICWRCPRGAPQKNRKRTNFYRTLSKNFSIFFIGTIFHSDEKILIKKIATVLSQSDHSISIGFFIGIKIDYRQSWSHLWRQQWILHPLHGLLQIPRLLHPWISLWWCWDRLPPPTSHTASRCPTKLLELDCGPTHQATNVLGYPSQYSLLWLWILDSHCQPLQENFLLLPPHDPSGTWHQHVSCSRISHPKWTYSTTTSQYLIPLTLYVITSSTNLASLPRLPDHHLPRRLLASWVHCAWQPVGRTQFNLSENICGMSATHPGWGCPRWWTTRLLAAHGAIMLIMGNAQPRLDQPMDCCHAPLLWMAPNVGPRHKWRKVCQTLTSDTQWAKWTKHNWWVLAVCTPPVFIHYSSLFLICSLKVIICLANSSCLTHHNKHTLCSFFIVSPGLLCFISFSLPTFFPNLLLYHHAIPSSSHHKSHLDLDPDSSIPSVQGTQHAQTNTDMDSPLFGSDSSVSSCASPSDMSYPPYSPFKTSNK